VKVVETHTLDDDIMRGERMGGRVLRHVAHDDAQGGDGNPNGPDDNNAA
jgi:hypothetical protein